MERVYWKVEDSNTKNSLNLHLCRNSYALNLLICQNVPSLAMQDITFSACGNTWAKVEEKSGKEVKLIEGVRIVPVGVLRIMELQEQEYAYIRP